MSSLHHGHDEHGQSLPEATPTKVHFRPMTTQKGWPAACCSETVSPLT